MYIHNHVHVYVVCGYVCVICVKYCSYRHIHNYIRTYVHKTWLIKCSII